MVKVVMVMMVETVTRERVQMRAECFKSRWRS